MQSDATPVGASLKVTDLEGVLRRAAADLRELSYSFAVVGGLAVSARADPRLTRDADLAVAVESEEQAEALVAALLRRGYTVVASVEQAATGRLATVRLLPGTDEARGAY